MSDRATCLTCGAAIFDPTAGSCHECGAKDGWIGSQWLRPGFPREVMPFALIEGSDPTRPEAALDVERLARALPGQPQVLTTESGVTLDGLLFLGTRESIAAVILENLSNP